MDIPEKIEPGDYYLLCGKVVFPEAFLRHQTSLLPLTQSPEIVLPELFCLEAVAFLC